MISDAGDDVGEPGLGIDVIEATSLDERVQDRGATAAGVGAGEQIGGTEWWRGRSTRRQPVTGAGSQTERSLAASVAAKA
jgi:hypothetical protein